MQAASRNALEAVRAASGDARGADLTGLAEQLYSVAALLVAQPRLRRALADPASEPGRREELAQSLFGDQLSAEATTLVRAAARQRWSRAWDFVDAFDVVGDDTLFAAAEADGSLDTVEDEVFRLQRILAGQGEATALLDEQSVPPERRLGLLDTLLAGKVSPITKALVGHAVASTRKRSVLLALDDLLEEAARRRERSLAKVLSASPLSTAQVDRLAQELGQLYGRPITVRADVDPSIRGGLYIRVGDEVIDGTVTNRLNQLREAFTA